MSEASKQILRHQLEAEIDELRQNISRMSVQLKTASAMVKVVEEARVKIADTWNDRAHELDVLKRKLAEL